MTLAPSSMRGPWLYHLELNRTPQEPTSLCNQVLRGCPADGELLRGAGEAGGCCESSWHFGEGWPWEIRRFRGMSCRSGFDDPASPGKSAADVGPPASHLLCSKF